MQSISTNIFSTNHLWKYLTNIYSTWTIIMPSLQMSLLKNDIYVLQKYACLIETLLHFLSVF